MITHAKSTTHAITTIVAMLSAIMNAIDITHAMTSEDKKRIDADDDQATTTSV